MIKDKTGKTLNTKQVVVRVIGRILNYFLDIKLMLLRWVGYIPSHLTRNIVYKLSGMKIGRGSTFHMWANFFQPKNIEIGKGTIIGDHSFLDGRD